MFFPFKSENEDVEETSSEEESLSFCSAKIKEKNHVEFLDFVMEEFPRVKSCTLGLLDRFHKEKITQEHVRPPTLVFDCHSAINRHLQRHHGIRRLNCSQSGGRKQSDGPGLLKILRSTFSVFESPNTQTSEKNRPSSSSFIVWEPLVCVPAHVEQMRFRLVCSPRWNQIYPNNKPLCWRRCSVSVDSTLSKWLFHFPTELYPHRQSSTMQFIVFFCFFSLSGGADGKWNLFSSCCTELPC